MKTTKHNLRKALSTANSLPELQVHTASPLMSGPEAQNEAVLTTLAPSSSQDPDVSIVLEQQSEHKQKVGGFQKVFKDHLQNAPVRHDHVSVLLLSWEKDIDDCNVDEEVASLQKIFEEQYSFEVTRGRMNHDQRPQYQMHCYLAEFLKANNKPNSLLIIYYGGHGSYDSRGPNPGLKLHASKSQRSPEEKRNDISWRESESIIGDPDADVLVIFDCCQAGGVGGHDTRQMSSPINPYFEFLAACAPDRPTRKPGPESFTSALMCALDSLRKDDKPFTTNTLLEKIKMHEQLPKDQQPQLTTRKQYADAFIWITPLNLSKKQMPRDMPHSCRRQPDYECIDLRLHYYTTIRKEDVSYLAQMLSKKIQTDKGFMAKDAVLLNTSSKTSRRNETVYKATNHFLSFRKRRRSSTSLRESPSDLGAPIVISSDNSSLHAAGPSRLAKRRKSNGLGDYAHQDQHSTTIAPGETPIGRPLYHLQMFVYGSFLGVLTPLTNGVARMRSRVTN